MTIIVALSSNFWGVCIVDLRKNNFLDSEKSEYSMALGKHVLMAAHGMVETRQK